MASIFGKLFRTFMIDRKAGDRDISALKEDLTQSNQTILDQLSNAPDNAKSREQLAHVIGIERWAQSRLKVALGESLKMDEYDGYRPDVSKPLSELAFDFAQTRHDTLELADQLAAVPGVETQIVTHNDMGEMRIRSWLQYLEIHAGFELRKVK